MSDNREPVPFEVYEPGVYLHGTKADLAVGEMLVSGRESNFEGGRVMNYVYFTATLDAATWGAELSSGEGPGRIYIVEPTGEFEDDPNLTDKKFPGNPTQSFRSRYPLRVVGELVDWVGHSPETLSAMRAGLQRIRNGPNRGLSYEAPSNRIVGSPCCQQRDAATEYPIPLSHCSPWPVPWPRLSRHRSGSPTSSAVNMLAVAQNVAWTGRVGTTTGREYGDLLMEDYGARLAAASAALRPSRQPTLRPVLDADPYDVNVFRARTAANLRLVGDALKPYLPS